MKIARIRNGSSESYGVIHGDSLLIREDLATQLNVKLPDSIDQFLFGNLLDKIRTAKLTFSGNIDQYKLLSPIPNPPKIICLGYNYLDHAKERGTKSPEEPVIFMKPRTALIGTDEGITCPKFVTQLDYEGELAFVIGKECKSVQPEDAMDNVFGYMVFNDVSARDIQFKESQWTRSKSFDTFAPSGPWITTKDEVEDPHNLRIVTKVNGEVRQDSSTKNMALKIDRIVASLSKVMTLEKGDIVATGTPSGVAAFMTQPRFLNHGDVVEIAIQNLGKIRNNVVFV
ncbi:MAG: fumarylacetoacetate hydrolase family protein [Nitrososphaerales archaeon]